jgi:hypothetical protein
MFKYLCSYYKVCIFLKNSIKLLLCILTNKLITKNLNILRNLYNLDYQLYIPGGGLWIFPCIWSKNGFNICPPGVSSNYFAWFNTFFGIGFPVKNSHASSVKLLQLWSIKWYF